MPHGTAHERGPTTMALGIALVALAVVTGGVAAWALIAKQALVLAATGALWLLILIAYLVLQAGGDGSPRRRRGR